MEKPSDTKACSDDLEQDYLDLQIANLKVIDQEKERKAARAAHDRGIGEKPDLDIESLIEKPFVAMEDDVFEGINEEVMKAYLNRKLRIENEGKMQFYHLHIEYLLRSAKSVKKWADALWEYLDDVDETVFVTWREENQWKLIIATDGKKGKFYFYDPNLQKRLGDENESSQHVKRIAKFPVIMQWPHEQYSGNSGILVLLAIEKWMERRRPFVWTQEEANEDAAEFRPRAFEFLAEHFRLKRNRQPYTPPEQEVVHVRPVVLITSIKEPSTLLNPEVMHVYMKYLLDGYPEHSFRVVRQFPPLAPIKPTYDILARQINSAFSSGGVKTFYVPYCENDRWGLVVVVKDEKFLHYAPAGNTMNESRIARTLKGLVWTRSREEVEWPTSEMALSGDTVLLAVRQHRDFPKAPYTEMAEAIVKSLRTVIVKQLEKHYQVVTNPNSKI